MPASYNGKFLLSIYRKIIPEPFFLCFDQNQFTQSQRQLFAQYNKDHVPLVYPLSFIIIFTSKCQHLKKLAGTINANEQIQFLQVTQAEK